MSEQEFHKILFGMLETTNEKLDKLIIDFTVLKTKFQVRAGIVGAIAGLVMSVITGVIVAVLK